MTREENQSRHEKLIDFLSQFETYQLEDGEPALRKVKQELTSDKFKDIDINDINKAVVLITDFLNLNGGSNSDINLYKLLQVYFKNSEYRAKINALIREA